jgi:hypothetical protein
MFYLHMAAEDFGLSGVDFVKAPYASLEDARAQGDHNRKIGKQRPIKIVDEDGKTVFDYEKKQG